MSNYQEILMRAEYNFSNFPKALEIIAPNLKDKMIHEYLIGYNEFADRCNSGALELLNSQFETLYPTYFDDNQDTDIEELIEYNTFMASGLNKIAESMNSDNVSNVLSFFVKGGNPSCGLRGKLKLLPQCEIGMMLFPIEK